MIEILCPICQTIFTIELNKNGECSHCNQIFYTNEFLSSLFPNNELGELDMLAKDGRDDFWNKTGGWFACCWAWVGACWPNENNPVFGVDGEPKLINYFFEIYSLIYIKI